MTPEQLKAMLGIKPGAPKGAERPPVRHGNFSNGFPPPAPGDVLVVAGPYCLALDEWDVAQGERLAAQAGDANEAAWADFHALAFLESPKPIPCTDQLRVRFVAAMLDSTDYHALHTGTMLNGPASNVAAKEFATAFAAMERTVAKRKAKRATRPDPAKDAADEESAALLAAGRAAAAAEKEVGEMEECCRGLGGDGGTDGRMDPARVQAAFERVKNDPALRRIFELAGRFRRVAQSKQRQKTSHGCDDITGVEMDGDVGRLLPHELAQLADPELEADAMRRLVERQSLCRQFKGSEKVGRGPIVVCVDESGSMSGEPVARAKAFALAMAWVARHQGRWCCLIGYSGGSEGNLLALRPGKWDEVALLDWLGHFYGGGTTMDVPLAELPGRYWKELSPPKGKTDVVLITDAQVNVPSTMRDAFNAWKKVEKIRCIGLVVGAGAGQLESVCDEVHLVGQIGADKAGIERCLSV